MPFKKAKRIKQRIRMAVGGPSGSGKTLGALRIAFGLCGDWSKVFVVDTENDSALSYANDPATSVGEFMHDSLRKPYTPSRYVEKIKEAVEAGAEVVVVDSLSHEWDGPGGVKETHDNLPGNAFTNWGKVNPIHAELIDYLVNQCPVHVIATLRAKTKYALNEEDTEGGGKKTKVERLGVEPIMRPGTEYEFLLYVELDRLTHRADVVTKRGSMVPDMRPVELTVDLGRQLAQWANSGEEREPMTLAEARAFPHPKTGVALGESTRDKWEALKAFVDKSKDPFKYAQLREALVLLLAQPLPSATAPQVREPVAEPPSDNGREEPIPAA